MKAPLHSHPKLKNWPPAVGGSYGAGDSFAMPGGGTLTEVIIVIADPNDPDATPRRLTVVVGEVYAVDPIKP